MEFSSLVLMEVDPESKSFKKELGGYQLDKGAQYITKFYTDGSNIFISFTCDRDVEEWEYSAIFYYFSKELFLNEGYSIEDIDEEYNPAWFISFEYKEDREYIEERLILAGELMEKAMEKVFIDIQGKEAEFQ